MSNAIERWLDARRAAPFRGSSDDPDQMDRLFSDFSSTRGGGDLGDFDFLPSSEISEIGNNYVLKIDLPGVHKDQVKVEVDKDQLTINAERREEKESENGRKYLSEVCYGSYTRCFTLPGPVDEKKVNSKFEDGVLTVKVPKIESDRAKQIAIH